MEKHQRYLVAALIVLLVRDEAGGLSIAASCAGRCLADRSDGDQCDCDGECSKDGRCCGDFVPECAAIDQCENRCSATFQSSNPCQCDSSCERFGNCCEDFVSTCRNGSCIGRCFGERVRGQCDCDERCSGEGTCCNDYVKECADINKCENRCFSGYERAKPCQCNDQCGRFGNCCPDFKNRCLNGSCAGECGKELPRTSCQCNKECLSKSNCCDDFSAICTAQDSCANLCGLKSDVNRTCQCHEDCADEKNCCEDYKEECDSDFLCNGKCNVERNGCSCKATCVNDKTCCTDYARSCEEGSSWIDDTCTPKRDMTCPEGFSTPPLIVFGIDGLRNDYLYRNITPNLHKLARCGVHTPYLRSSYPTDTFPNFYTIATGLYPESHGIVDNRFYDHDLDREFRLGRRETRNSVWWGGEPIWVTAMNQGYKSASYFWVGSDVNITKFPDYYFPYEGRVKNEQRVYQVLQWLDFPKEKRPTFITSYMSMVDSVGHSAGPTGPRIDATIAEADRIIGMLMDGLKHRKLDTCVNIIIVSDHGMAEVDCDKSTYVRDYGINARNYYTDLSVSGRIGKSKNKSLHGLFDAEDVKGKLECRVEETHFQAYLKQKYLPKRLHYAKSDRIEDVHLLLDQDWRVLERKRVCLAGMHGWDPQYKDMHATFLGHGPSLKRGYNMTEAFENIELYNLFCDLLNVTPAPNNGTYGGLGDLLGESNFKSNTDVFAEPQSCNQQSNLQIDENRDDRSSEPGVFTEIKWGVGYGEILQSREESVAYCRLWQPGRYTAYDLQKKTPYYVFFTLSNQTREQDGKTQNVDYERTFCMNTGFKLTADQSKTCSDFGKSASDVKGIFLYPSEFPSSNEGRSLANLIPVYTDFLPVWTRLVTLMELWSKRYGAIATYVGPAFDYDYNGRADSRQVLKSRGKFVRGEDHTSSPIPTHIFAVVLRCKETVGNISQCGTLPNNFEAISMIIPNFSEEPCYQDDKEQWITYVLTRNLARVRDVELLTGISFFPQWNALYNTTYLDAIKLKLRLPDPGSDWLQSAEESKRFWQEGVRITAVNAGVLIIMLTILAAVLLYRIKYSVAV